VPLAGTVAGLVAMRTDRIPLQTRLAPDRGIILPVTAPINALTDLGVGVTLLLCSRAANSWSVEAVYDYYVRNDRYSAHQAMIKFSAKF